MSESGGVEARRRERGREGAQAAAVMVLHTCLYVCVKTTRESATPALRGFYSFMSV